MPPLIVWFNLVVGSLTLAAALLSWRRGRREGSHARRWQSVTFIVLSLCAWFSAVAILVGPPAAGLWSALVLVASVLALCTSFIGILSMDREERATRQR
jgi:hypothetical protein